MSDRLWELVKDHVQSPEPLKMKYQNENLTPSRVKR